VGNYMRGMGIKAQWVKPFTHTTIHSDFSSQLQKSFGLFKNVSSASIKQLTNTSKSGIMDMRVASFNVFSVETVISKDEGYSHFYFLFN
jgi:hypothetical protein